jgi:D-glycero-D-manno-heptose 1,7-bisphosphate phosphatase
MTGTLRKAVFLDRDGVLNQEAGEYITNPEDFKVLPHIVKPLKMLADAGFLLIVVTNQGGVAKGLYTIETLKQMHKKLEDFLNKYQVKLTDIYFCPHHPDFSNCLCRKPQSLLIEKAIAKYNINPKQSYFIGDKKRDIDAGNGADVAGFLIEANSDWLGVAKNILQHA